MSELIKQLREPDTMIEWTGDDGLMAQAADRIEALEAVALHAERHVADPSWEKHKVNLKAALDALPQPPIGE